MLNFEKESPSVLISLCVFFYNSKLFTCAYLFSWHKFLAKFCIKFHCSSKCVHFYLIIKNIAYTNSNKDKELITLYFRGVGSIKKFTTSLISCSLPNWGFHLVLTIFILYITFLESPYKTPIYHNLHIFHFSVFSTVFFVPSPYIHKYFMSKFVLSLQILVH